MQLIYHHLEDNFSARVRICFIDTPVGPRNRLKLLQPLFGFRSTADPRITCDICFTARHGILPTDPHRGKEPLLPTVTTQALMLTHDVVVVRRQNPLQTKHNIT